MKKLSATSKRHNLHTVPVSRRLSLFAKLSLGTAMAMLLSSASSVLAKKIDIIDQRVLQSMEKATAVYSQGNDKKITAAYDSQNNADAFDLSRAGYVTALNTAKAAKVNASDDYANFLNNTLSRKSDSTINVLAEPVSKQLMTRRFIPFNAMQRDARANRGVMVGNEAIATHYSSIAIGRDDPDCTNVDGGRGCMASRSVAERAIAIGLSSEAKNYQSIAIGVSAKAFAKSAIAFSPFANALSDYSIAFGYGAKTSAAEGVSIGSDSVSDRAIGVAGYSPILQGSETSNESQWKSTRGALSIGNAGENITRQITGVAAGTQETDAVNVAQLKSLQTYVDKGWKLSVDGKNAKALGIDDTVDLAAGSNNLNITKGAGDNKVTFDLAKDLTLDKVAAGANTFDATGLIIKDGPKIMVGGIDAGSKKITHVAQGTDETDAVNVAQLKSLQTYVDKGWKLSVDGKNAKALGIDDTVDLAAGSNNLNITKGAGDNKVTFDLAKDLTLDKVAAGANTFDATGLIIANGPKIMTDGIHAGSKKITGVKEGTTDTDAVNFRQLNKAKQEVQEQVEKQVQEVEKQVASHSFVKQDKETDPITIGKDTGGDKINITNKNGKVRILSGVKAGTENTDAVNFSQLKYVQQEIKDTVKEVQEQVAASSFVKQDADTKHITIGKETDGDKIDITNNKNEQRTLTGVKAGDLSEDSKEAVTGSQLFATNKNVTNLQTAATNIAKTFGGNAKYENGQWTNPTFTVKTIKKDGQEETTTYHNVAEALTGVGTSVSNVQNKLTEQVNNVVNKVQGDALLWSETDKAFIAQHGEGKDRRSSKIKFVQGGDLSENSDEVVIGSQMHSTGSRIARFFGGGADFGNGNWSDPTFKIKRVKADGTEEEQSYTSVAGAFEGVGTTFTNIKNEITQQINNEISNVKGDSLVKKDATTNHITIGKEVAGSKIDISNKTGEARTLSGVKAGTQNTDAVNFSQLKIVEKDIKDQVAASSFVKQDSNTKHITIGKETDGDKIDIANNKNEQRTLTGIKNGDISEISKEAVTGSQLFEINKTVATYLGGGAGYKDGKWTDPTFTVKTVKNDGQEETTIYKNVADALSGVGSSITNVKNEITKEVNNTITTVKGDALSWSVDDKAFSAQHEKDGAKTHSKITHLLDGNIAADSTDAITGKQLYSVGNALSTYLGGGAKYENGQWTAPSFKVNTVNAEGQEKSETYQNIADALAGVGTSFTNVQNKVTNEITNQINHLQSDNSAVVHYDKADKNGTINYASVTFGGKDKTLTALHNVANGNIVKDSHDVVTGDQINTIFQNVAKFLGGNAAFNNGNFTSPTYKLSSFSEEGTLGDTSYDNVGAAFAGLDANVKHVNNHLENVVTEFTEKVNNITQLVQGDALLWSKEANAFVADHGKGDAKTKSKITHILDGNIASGSTDAVTGGQLYSMNEQLATYFGGGAGYDKEGKWTAPTFKVKTVKKDSNKVEETSYNSVADAFAGVSTSITDIHNEVNNQITNIVSDSLVKQDASGLIKIGAEKEGGEINIANTSKADRTLSGVKDAVQNNEAVNKGQLDKTINNVNNEITNKFNSLNENITNITQQVTGDALLWSKEANAFVADHDKDGAKTNSKIMHLKAGDITAESTDAVNGSQLYALGSGIASSFGGGAKYEKGQWTAPTFTFKTVNDNGDKEDKIYKNVAEAFAGVGTSITNVENKITNEITNQINHLQSDDSAVVHYDKKDNQIDYTSITFGGKSKNHTTLRNVANGIIGDKSHEAITGGQIYKIGDDIAKFLGGSASFNNGAFTGPTYELSQVEKDGKVTNKLFTDVGSAFAGLDTNIKNVNDRIKEVSQGVAKDSLNWSSAEGAFVASHGEGDARKDSKITHILAGKITSASTDAINGSQLYSLGDDVAKSLGGNAKYENGTWMAPSFKITTVKEDGSSEDKTYKNVTAAFEDVGTSFTNIKNEITKQINHLQSDDSAVVHYDKKGDGEIDYTNVTFGKGKDSTAVALHNVANGAISSKSRDAINGQQINTIGEDVAKFLGGNSVFRDGAFTGLTYNLSEVSKDGNITDKPFSDVGTAFAGLDTNIKNVNKRIKEVSEGVAQDSLNWNEQEKAFVAQHGKEKTNSKIKFLAAGDISAASTDAMNGSQLYSMSNTLASYLGGGAEYKEGNWKAPDFKVQQFSEDGKAEEKTYHDVAAAFEGVKNSVTNMHNEITNQINNVVNDSLVKQDETTKHINIGGETDGTQISIASKDKADRTLSGVKAAEKGNEAVNKEQFDKGLEQLSNKLQSEDSAVVLYDKQKEGQIDYTNVTLGKGQNAAPVGLHNVADGKITENSHDAVTGGQLNTISQDVAKFLGGAATFKDGTFTGPTYTLSSVDAKGEVIEKSYNDVGTAFAGLDNNVKNVNQRIKEVSEGVAQDSLSWSKDDNAFSALHGEKEGAKTNSKIKYLAAGDISAASTEAINGSQLFETNNKVASYLGGNAQYENGKWSDPTFKVRTVTEDGNSEEQEYKNVAAAFEGVGTSFTNIKNEITNQINHLQSDDSAVVHYNKKDDGETDYTSVTFGKGDKTAPVALHNVADGNIADGSHDAVNGHQINTISQDVAKFLGGDAVFKEGYFTGPTYNLSDVSVDGTVKKISHNNVGSAFAGLDTNIKSVNNHLTNVVKDFTEKVNNITQEVKGDALLWNEDAKAFVAQHGEGDKRKNSKITSLQAGKVAEDSTDAVNGSQIYAMNNTLARYLGGGASYENGTWTAPSFKIVSFKEDGSSEEIIYNDVAAAFAGMNTSFTKLHHELSDNVEQNALLWSDADKAFVAVHGKGDDKRNSKLSHLVDGDISAGSTEAITGNQLYQLNQTLALYLGGGASYANGQWTAPHFQVTQFKNDGSSAGEKSYENVAGAFEGVNGSLSSINDRITNVAQNVSTNGLNWNEELGGYDARHNGQDSKITHVADGDVSKGSKEAVNGGQLWETNKKVEAVENRVDGMDQQLQAIEDTVTNDAVKYDKGEDGHKSNKITLVGGNESDPVLIENVADGRIESGSKEAVNGGQLHDYTDKQMKIVLDDAKKYTDERVTDLVNNGVNESKAYTDMKFETLNYAVEDVRKEARQAAAIGLAVSNLRYYDIPGSLSVSFGTGVWRSQSAFAIGAGYTSEDGNIRSNISVTSAGGHWGVGAGITLRLR